MIQLRKTLSSSRTQSVMMIALAILVGSGSYFYFLNYESRLERNNALVSIYVAAKDLPSGITFRELKSENGLVQKKFPEKSLPNNVVTDLSQVTDDLRSRGPIVAGQIVTTSYFTSDTRSDVSLPIPPGMLAVSISVDDVGRVSNFVLPGSQVVVFATSASGSSGGATRILLPNTLVLGIGNQTGLNLSATTLSPSQLVTIAVTPRDAQRVVLASQSMRLSLALAYGNNPAPLVNPNSQTTESTLFSS